MDVQSIVSELKAERNRISQAITILEEPRLAGQTAVDIEPQPQLPTELPLSGRRPHCAKAEAG